MATKRGRGGPRKDRALTTILEKAGAATMPFEGKRRARRRVLAQLVWEAMTTGQVSFDDGEPLTLKASDWAGIVKFVMAHVDGRPRAEVDVTSGGKAVTLVYQEVAGREMPTAPDAEDAEADDRTAD